MLISTCMFFILELHKSSQLLYDAGPCWSLSVHPLSLLPQPVGHLFSDWLSSADRRSDHIRAVTSHWHHTQTGVQTPVWNKVFRAVWSFWLAGITGTAADLIIWKPERSPGLLSDYTTQQTHCAQAPEAFFVFSPTLFKYYGASEPKPG